MAVLGYRARSGHQRLAKNLTPINALPAFIGAGRAIVILLDLLEIEQFDQIIDGLLFAHLDGSAALVAV